jgi:hypothetical protein
MKAALQLGFILFYITSAYETSQIRTIQVVHKVKDSNSADDALTIGESRKKLDRGLPRYRDSKKASNDLQYRTVAVVNPAPDTGTPLLIAFPPLAGLQITLEDSHSRAPPSVYQI